MSIIDHKMLRLGFAGICQRADKHEVYLLESEVLDYLAKYPSPVLPSEFCVGDVVQLKSGGPKMVVRTAHSKSVTVNWCSPDGHPQLAEFITEQLVAVGKKLVGEMWNLHCRCQKCAEERRREKYL